MTALQSVVRDACAASLPPESPGGDIGISLRIDAAGAVSDACIDSDFVGDEALRRCALGQTRSFRFPSLSRGDILNLGVDVSFRPSGIPRRALCRP